MTTDTVATIGRVRSKQAITLVTAPLLYTRWSFHVSSSRAYGFASHFALSLNCISREAGLICPNLGLHRIVALHVFYRSAFAVLLNVKARIVMSLTLLRRSAIINEL